MKTNDQKINDFINQNPGLSYQALVEGIKKKHKITTSVDAVRKRCRRLAIPNKRPVRDPNLTTEEKIAIDRQVTLLQTKNKETDGKYKSLLGRISVLEAEKEAFLSLDGGIDPYKFEYTVPSEDSEATAVVLASDWHIEEIVRSESVNGLNKYNPEIAKKRVEQFFKNTLRLVEKEQNAVKIKNLVIALLGDIISGNIHEELLENCAMPPIDAIIMAENLVIAGLEYILENSELNLIIPCHVGNHTRITHKVHISTEKGNSLESFMYHHLQNYFKDNSRVTFVVAEGYLSYLKIYDQTICFQHGHAIKYGGGVGGLTIPANKAIAQWEKLRHADLYCFGHFHQFFDGGNFICNGSLIGYNSFAVFIKGGFEKPRQAFFLIDKKRNCKTVVCPVLFDI